MTGNFILTTIQTIQVCILIRKSFSFEKNTNVPENVHFPSALWWLSMRKPSANGAVLTPALDCTQHTVVALEHL